MADRPGDRRRPADSLPDIEIGATARARELRFTEKPRTDVEFHGRSVRRTGTDTTRENLPEQVEPGRKYRDVKAGWRAKAWIDEDEETTDPGHRD